MDRERVVLLVLLAWLALPMRAFAGPEIGHPEAGKSIYMFGAGKQVPACQSCHSPDGTGSDDIGTPRLASQVYSYVVKQLTDFATNRRIDDVMQQMNHIAASLSDQQRLDVAAFVHLMDTPFTGSNLEKLQKEGMVVGDPARGRHIVERGLPAQGVPACQACHGFHGRSAGRMYPRLSGQNYVYLKHELESFRRGAHGAPKAEGRSNDFMGQMREVAGKLTDRDIVDVASFLTGAEPPTPPENPDAPGQ
jgi:cytochrome c553